MRWKRKRCRASPKNLFKTASAERVNLDICRDWEVRRAHDLRSSHRRGLVLCHLGGGYVTPGAVLCGSPVVNGDVGGLVRRPSLLDLVPYV